MNTTFVRLLVIQQFIAGSVQRIFQTVQLAWKAKGIDDVERYFNHPFLITLVMMAGQSLCLVGYPFKKFIGKSNNSIEEDEEIPVNLFVLFPAALIDVIGAVFLNIGLVLSKDAGTNATLASSMIIWSAIISMPVFRRYPSWFQWLGMVTIALGILVKTSIMIPLLLKSTS